METSTKATRFVLQCPEGSEQIPSSLDRLLLTGRRMVTQWDYREVAALQRLIAHTILCTVYLSFTGVISPSMNQWNYKLIMHSQAWIIAHIMIKCMRFYFFLILKQCFACLIFKHLLLSEHKSYYQLLKLLPQGHPL